MSDHLRQRGLIRQWKIIRALQASRHGLTWADLIAAAEERVHLRTIRRDLDTLTFAGFPIDVESNLGVAHARIYMRRNP